MGVLPDLGEDSRLPEQHYIWWGHDEEIKLETTLTFLFVIVPKLILLFWVVLVPKQDVLLQWLVEDPSLLWHVSKAATDSDMTFQQGHLRVEEENKPSFSVIGCSLCVSWRFIKTKGLLVAVIDGRVVSGGNSNWIILLKLTCPSRADRSELFPLPTPPQIPTSEPWKGGKKSIEKIFSTSEIKRDF